MKKTILRYGMYSAITIVALFLVSFIAFSGASYSVQEVLGYTSMIIAQLFVFFGIKHYRDQQNGGLLSFTQGMKVGVLIVLIPSLIFGIFDVLYVQVINPEFMEKYYQDYLSQLRQSLPPAEFEQQRAAMESQRAIFSNPAFNFLIMFFTVFVIGVIVTVISSLVLKRGAGAGMRRAAA